MAENKKKEIELGIRIRQENRQRSVADMIQRTRQITRGGGLSSKDLLPNSQHELQRADLFKVPTPKNKMDIKQRHDDMLRRNSQKYDELMKQKRDDLKRKRGALELNSDLDIGQDYGLVQQQKAADLPQGIIGSNNELSNYKSKLY